VVSMAAAERALAKEACQATLAKAVEAVPESQAAAAVATVFQVDTLRTQNVFHATSAEDWDGQVLHRRKWRTTSSAFAEPTFRIQSGSSPATSRCDRLAVCGISHVTGRKDAWHRRLAARALGLQVACDFVHAYLPT